MTSAVPFGSGAFVGRGRDRTDDRAARRVAVGLAFVKQVREHVRDALEVSDAAPRLVKPRGRDAPDAAAVRSVFEFEQRGNLLEAEPESLGAFDEADAVHVAASVAAIGAQSPPWLRHQAAALVIAHGFDSDGRGLGDVADSESCLIGHKSALLTPYRSTDFTLAPR